MEPSRGQAAPAPLPGDEARALAARQPVVGTPASERPTQGFVQKNPAQFVGVSAAGRLFVGASAEAAQDVGSVQALFERTELKGKEVWLPKPSSPHADWVLQCAPSGEFSVLRRVPLGDGANGHGCVLEAEPGKPAYWMERVSKSLEQVEPTPFRSPEGTPILLGGPRPIVVQGGAYSPFHAELSSEQMALTMLNVMARDVCDGFGNTFSLNTMTGRVRSTDPEGEVVWAMHHGQPLVQVLAKDGTALKVAGRGQFEPINSMRKFSYGRNGALQVFDGAGTSPTLVLHPERSGPALVALSLVGERRMPTLLLHEDGSTVLYLDPSSRELKTDIPLADKSGRVSLHYRAGAFWTSTGNRLALDEASGLPGERAAAPSPPPVEAPRVEVARVEVQAPALDKAQRAERLEARLEQVACLYVEATRPGVERAAAEAKLTEATDLMADGPFFKALGMHLDLGVEGVKVDVGRLANHTVNFRTAMEMVERARVRSMHSDGNVRVVMPMVRDAGSDGDVLSGAVLEVAVRSLPIALEEWIHELQKLKGGHVAAQTGAFEAHLRERLAAAERRGDELAVTTVRGYLQYLHEADVVAKQLEWGIDPHSAGMVHPYPVRDALMRWLGAQQAPPVEDWVEQFAQRNNSRELMEYQRFVLPDLSEAQRARLKEQVEGALKAMAPTALYHHLELPGLVSDRPFSLRVDQLEGLLKALQPTAG